MSGAVPGPGPTCALPLAHRIVVASLRGSMGIARVERLRWLDVGEDAFGIAPDQLFTPRGRELGRPT